MDEAAVSLERLLTVLGGGVLEAYSLPKGLAVRVTGVQVYDPADQQTWRGQLVLGVGVGPQDAGDLIRQAGAAMAAGVVLRGGDASLREVAAEAGVAVLVRTAWVTWSQLVGLIRAGLASAGLQVDDELESVPLGDLTAFANAVGNAAGGAVTIEDMQSRVLAFSRTDESVDEIRRQTILGQRMSPERVEALRENGFFRALWTSGDVVHRQAVGDSPERLAIAIKAGGEIFGSIWVAAAGRDLPASVPDTLRAAARAAVPHMIHRQTREGGEPFLIEESARALLNGHVSAEVFALRSSLRLDTRCAVLLFYQPEAIPARGLLNLISLECAAFRRPSVAFAEGRRIYVLLAELASDDEAMRIARRLSEQLEVKIGVGDVVDGLAEAPASRDAASLAHRVLLGREESVARLRDVASAATLALMLDEIGSREYVVLTPVALLAGYDSEHDSDLLGSLRAYLDHFGDVPAAAKALGLHANSLRYRIRRIEEVSGLDIHDPEQRLVAELQLRLWT
ncbi:DNA-binding transcriptional regulator, PucR family [Amycolatopsis xylanica]|uniref:DNA-binding transcriptional regulator, PucR family n=1 Tax=Amycolatopsis xylanica TaxID=589385 RepID=A0A1H3S0V0_9PSEU|nr:helix-turn-helix domain-containing protein [Amycolatopsis xylanica]SDZ31683.1 DNA-binding transcriptional regulator, PucR family [Amycolatopsis xylanica]